MKKGIKPNKQDYVVYHTFRLIEEFVCLEDTCMLNGSKSFRILEVYYSIIDNMKNVGVFRSLDELEDYHFDWMQDLVEKHYHVL